MDSILITTQFPHRISLSQAAQISGYHQDYLGQLCRLGKLRASKIGRNWYTTQSEIQSLISNPEASNIEEFIQPQRSSEEVNIDAIQAPTEAISEAPMVTANYLISEVQNVPIRLEQRPQVDRSHHSLQTLVTRMRLDELRNNVLQVSGLVKQISDEQAEQKQMLMRHEQILQGRADLRERYIPSLGIADSYQTGVDMIEFPNPFKEAEKAKHVNVVWLWPALAMVVAVAAASLFIVSNVSNDEPELSTVIYKAENSPAQGQPIEVIIPQVAGDQVAIPLQQ